MNEIVEDTDGFYYWDEQDNLIGPFNTFQQAEIAFSACLRWEARDHVSTIRKMKDNMGL
jgi:hypothetical protein